MTTFNLNSYATLVVATLVLLLGKILVRRWRPLHTYSIPEPVVGGLFVCLLLFAAHRLFDTTFQFDAALKEPFMLAFFATIGLSANLRYLARGGTTVLVFLLVVLGLLLVQNGVGVMLAQLLGLDPLFGLIAGSITLSGGHGTGTAWSVVLTKSHGLTNATEAVMAAATFGLVAGGLIGGPVARLLMKRSVVTLPNNTLQTPPTSTFEQPNVGRTITAMVLIETLSLIAICLLAGDFLAGLLKNTIFELPTFVCVLFIGVVLSNALSFSGFYQIFDRALAILGNVSLALFLAIAMMTLKLWELAHLALPLIIILLTQTVIMALYAIFVTYRVMGKNYDAAVLAAGHCGFGLGATPTAVANMQAVTERFGPSPIAFLVVPMVGAFLIDILNAVVIKLFIYLVA